DARCALGRTRGPTNAHQRRSVAMKNVAQASRLRTVNVQPEAHATLILRLELRRYTPEIFVVIMKTTDATVLDKLKTHEPAADALVEPAIESRPRAATGVKEAKIYIDGKFYSEASAKVSVFDHGLLYGDGIFEGIRFYNGRVFRLEEHLARLWDSARSICLEIPMTVRDMTEEVLETIRQNHLRDGYIRLLVTRGIGNLGLNPMQCKCPSVIIIAAMIALYHESFYRK